MRFLAATWRPVRKGVAVVTTPVALSENARHTLMQIVVAPDDGDDGDGLPWSTMHGLKALTPCTAVVFVGLEPRRQREYFGQDIDDGPVDVPDADDIFWTHYWDSVCSYPDRTDDLRSVTMITDSGTMRAFRQTALYTDLFRLRGDEDMMHLYLPDGPGAFCG
jgi:hypothetical protein